MIISWNIFETIDLHPAGGIRAVRQGAVRPLPSQHQPDKDRVRLLQLRAGARPVVPVFRLWPFRGGQAGDAAVRAGERLAHRAVQRPAGKTLCLCGCARSCKAPGLSGRRRQGAHRPPAATVTGPPERAATATAAPRCRRAR